MKKATTKRFEVLLEPDGGGWHVSIRSVPGCRSWGKTIPTAMKNVREALACCDDVFADAAAIAARATLVQRVKLPAKANLERVERVRARLEKVIDEKDAVEAECLRALQLAGVSLADQGRLLGLSKEGVRRALNRGARRRASKAHRRRAHAHGSRGRSEGTRLRGGTRAP